MDGESLRRGEAEAMVVPPRGGFGRRGRKSGGRTKDLGEQPRTIDELEIRDIKQLPKGRALETPLHSRRKRVWQPSDFASPPASPSFVAPSNPAALSSASYSVPSQAKFVDGGGSVPFLPPAPASSIQDPLASPAPQCQSFNHGSDDDSDEDEDKEDTVVPVIPRVYRNLMETPLDQDTASEDAAGDPAPAADTVPAGGHDPADVLLSTTEKPWGLNVFDWRVFPNPPIPPESRREIFSQINVGPTTPSANPYDIFLEIWDRQIMEYIASETNKYAQQVASQMCKNRKLFPNSRISRWYDTTADELYVYFSLILAMGIVVKSRIEEYWSSTSDIFSTPGFRGHMYVDRFLLLTRCLHFNDNNNMHALELDKPEARLFKIQPILSHLSNKFQSMYTLGQNIALDESLLMWKGCLDIRQHIQNKAGRCGIKTYEICESQTGYLWRFEVHVNKKSPPQQIEDPLKALTPAIVLQLIRGLEHKGYTLWMDNYYQSPCLARRLKSLGFDCVGTLRTDRKFVPQVLHNLTKQDMRQGQIAGLTSGDVDVMVWRDNNRVAMISTYHGNGQQIIRGSTKPILIIDYNIMMGGVDKKDQLLAMYPVERIRTRVWYKKLFRRLLNTSVLNSYIIHRHTSSLNHRNFRISLIKSLLSKHSSYSPSPSPSPSSSPKKVKPIKVKPIKVKLNEESLKHYLCYLPMNSRQRLRRACKACKQKATTFCAGCDKTVCIGPCFLRIHS